MPRGKLLNAGLVTGKLKSKKKPKPKKKKQLRFKHPQLRFNTKPIRLTHSSKSTKSKTKRKTKSKRMAHKGAVGEFFQGVYKVGGGIARARTRSREVKLEEARLKALESAQIRKEAAERRFVASQEVKKPSRFSPKGKPFRKAKVPKPPRPKRPSLISRGRGKVKQVREERAKRPKLTREERTLEKTIREQEKIAKKLQEIQTKKARSESAKVARAEAQRKLRMERASLQEHREELQKQRGKKIRRTPKRKTKKKTIKPSGDMFSKLKKSGVPVSKGK